MGVVVRRASVEDAWELTRLRRILVHQFRPVHDEAWEYACKDALELALADQDGPIQAFVVDADDAPGKLAASSVGVLQQRLPSPDNLAGMSGYILSVSTDPGFRRRGYARAAVQATLDWMDGCGVAKTELLATETSGALYHELGFSAPQYGSYLTRWLPQPV